MKLLIFSVLMVGLLANSHANAQAEGTEAAPPATDASAADAPPTEAAPPEEQPPADESAATAEVPPEEEQSVETRSENDPSGENQAGQDQADADQADAGQTDEAGAASEAAPSWEGVTDIEELDLADLLDLPVIGASKRSQSQGKAPTAVTVITSRDIELLGYQNMIDVLRGVRGFFVASDRNYNFVGVRGFGVPGDYNSRLLVLINGHRLNDPLYTSTDPGWAFPVSVDMVDRIEVIRGPGSSVYGSNAFFGVINVITKSGATLNSVQAQGTVGSLGTQRARASYGQKFDSGLDLALGVQGGNSRGNEVLYYGVFDDPATNNGFVRNQDGEKFSGASLRLSFSDFTLTSAFSWRYKEVPTSAFGTFFPSNNDWTKDAWSFVDLAYNRTFSNGLSVLARLSYDYYVYRGLFNYDYDDTGDPADLYQNRDLGRGQRIGAEAQVAKTFAENYTFTVGAEVRDGFKLEQENFDDADVVADREFYLENSGGAADSTLIIGVYSQAELTFFDQLTLNAGIRYDSFRTESPNNSFSRTRDSFNPRVALIYRPTSSTNIKAIWGRAFRDANAYERFYTYGDAADGEAQLFNNALGAEKIETYELAIEQFFGKKVRALLNGYYYEIDNLISLNLIDALDNLQFQNSGTIQAFGGELEVEAKFDSGLRSRLSYAVQSARDKDTEIGITNSPRHLGKLEVIVPVVRDRLYISGQAQYMSQRKTILEVRDVRHHVLGNLTVRAENIFDGLTLLATVRNLFDQKYADPASSEHNQNAIAQDRRTLWLTAMYDLDL